MNKIKFIEGNTYNIEVNGKIEECTYCGCDIGCYVFEIIGTTKLVFKSI
jgi:hypothetical protein